MIDGIDGSEKEWNCTGASSSILPHWFVIDLGAKYTITKVRGRSQRNNDPIDVSIYISNASSCPAHDGDWGSAVASDIDTWKDTITWQEVAVASTVGRYMKVVVAHNENYPGSTTAPIRWGQLNTNTTIQFFDVYGDLYSELSLVVEDLDCLCYLDATGDLPQKHTIEVDEAAVISDLSAANLLGFCEKVVLDVAAAGSLGGGRWWYPKPSSGGGIILFEGFENTGTDEYWTDLVQSGGTLDYDYEGVAHDGHGARVCSASAVSNVTTFDKEFDSEIPIFYLRFYFYVSSWPSGNRSICRVKDEADNQVILIRLEPSNVLRGIIRESVTDNEATWTLSSGWHFLEVRYNATANTANIWLDGDYTSNYASSNTAPFGGLFTLTFGVFLGSTAGTILFDDIAIRDGSVVNEAIGGWALKDLVSRESTDGTGIFTDEAGSPSSHNDAFFSFDSLPTNPDEIKAVRLWLRGTQYGTKANRVKPALLIDGVQYKEKVRYPSGSKKNTYTQWVNNPATGGQFTAAEVNELLAGVMTQEEGSERYGGEISRMWLEVIAGKSGDAFLTHGPFFGGTNTSSIKVWVKLNESAQVKLRYAKTPAAVINNSGASETSAVTVADNAYTGEVPLAASMFCHTFTVSGLDQNAEYYFDVIVQQANGNWLSTYHFENAGLANPYWASLPKCKTGPTSTTSDFKIGFGADEHTFAADPEIWAAIASKEPTFFIEIGDEWANDGTYADDVFDGYDDTDAMAAAAYKEVMDGTIDNRRGFGAASCYRAENITTRMPLLRLWSDHDHVGNNPNKIGTFEYQATIYPKPTYTALDAFINSTPLHDLDGPGDLSGIATGGGTSSLVDLNKTFTGNVDPEDDIYPGMVVRKISGTLAYGIVKTVDSPNQITLCSNLSNGQTFLGGGAKYRIQRGGVWHKFSWGNAEIFCIDARYKRDPNKTPGSDKLDGTVYGRVNNGYYKSTHTATAGTNTLTVCDSTEANFGLESGTNKTCPGDLVHNLSQSTAQKDIYSLVKSVDSPTQITLEWPIYGQGSGDTIRIYESGASDHGSDALNIAAGHVQRTWLEKAVRESSADWRILVSETPLMHDEHRNHDKWCDYDGNTEWASWTSGWLQEGSLYYHWIEDPGGGEKPGGILRKQAGPWGGSEYQALRETGTKSDITASDEGHYLWYWDAANRRVYVYGNEYLEDEANPVVVYHPEFWKRCATRNYLMTKLQNLNAIWVGADRHIGALDDAAHDDDPWPHVSAGPLGVDAGLTHLSGGSWSVDNKLAFYDSQWQAGVGPVGSKTTPPGGVTEIGGFAILDVKNSSDRILVTMYERDGYAIETKYNAVSGSVAKGELSMNIIFDSTMVDETFDDPSGYDYDGWQEVTD
jgi:phosphodiesterase/alkaline phosphatase D-like protein